MEAEWRERAACREPENAAVHAAVYEEHVNQHDIARAKRICAGCDVTRECGLYALAAGERFGVWGGMSERERRRLLRRVKLRMSGGAGKRETA